MKIIISDLKIKHIDDLINLWKEAELPIRPNGRDTEENLKKQIREPNNFFLKATVNKEIVGVLIASHNKRKGWINRLAVLPRFRHRGIAAKLIAEAEKRLEAAGIFIIACLIEDWNDASKKLFKKNEYKFHKDIYYFTKRLKEDV